MTPPSLPFMAITFLYYRDLTRAEAYYRDVLGLPLVIDQGFAKIFRLADGAHVGLVDEARGMNNWQEAKCVQLCLRVPDVEAWYAWAEEAGLDPIKINVVVQHGVNDHTVMDLLEHFRGSGHIVRLIEFMDVGNRNGWRLDQVMPARQLLEEVQRRWPLRRVDQSYPGEVARRYKYVDGQGEIGFISSVTEPFCGDCSRARLSADGMLYTCLFANRGTDLRESLRDGADDEELSDILSQIWLQRADRYSELRRPEMAEAHILRKVEMYRIGG